MPLRCLLFSSDEGTAQSIGQLLGELGIEAEHCPDAVQAVERVTSQIFNLVIVDWDDQPEASSLLNTARGKKASERPLNLAAVGNDASVPLALGRGKFNSAQADQCQPGSRDPDHCARSCSAPRPTRRLLLSESLLRQLRHRSRQVLKLRHSNPAALKRMLQKLRKSRSIAASFFRAEPRRAPISSPNPKCLITNPLHASEIDPLNELEPMAASVRSQDSDDRLPERDSDEPRGLAWYLKSRSAPVPLPPVPAAPGKVELISFSEAASFSGSVPAEPANGSDQSAARAGQPAPEQEKRTEAALFAHIAGETPAEEEPKPRRNFNKFAALGVIALIFVVAFLEAPPSLWRPQAKSLVGRAALAARNWLNPQPVTTAPAPATHENFGRAGDEYKLPAAEAIPDASTDPNQIRVVPVVDPTIKPPKDPAAQPAPPNTDPKDNPDPRQRSPARPGAGTGQHGCAKSGAGKSTGPTGYAARPSNSGATGTDPALGKFANDRNIRAASAHAPTAPTSTNRDPMQPLTQKATPVRVASTGPATQFHRV